MDFRFTLSHTPRQSVSTDIELPDNSLGQNIDSVSIPARDDWSLGATPSVTVSGSVIGSSDRESEKWVNDYSFSTGLEYTISYNIDYDIPISVSPKAVHFLVLDGANNVLLTDVKTIGLSGTGTLSDSSTFTAPAGAVKFGFQCAVTNTFSNSGSFFEIQNNITGTVSSQAEPGVPTSQGISQPDGWQDCKLILERHDDFNSLIEHYDGGAGGAFIFYGNNGQENGGIDYLRHLEQVYGFNVQVNILTEFSFDETNYEEIFSGQVDISAKNEMTDNLLQAPIIRDDVWTKFITRRDTQVDLSSNIDLDGNIVPPAEPITINLTTQKVLKVHYSYEELNTSAVMEVSDNEYIQFTPGKFELDEMEDFYNLVPINNPALPGPTFDVKESGDYIFDIRWAVSLILGTTENHANSLDVFIQINEETPIAFSRSDQTSVGVDYTYFTYSGTSTLNEGDSVRIYAQQDSVSVLNWGFWGVDGLNNIALGGSYDKPRPNGMADIPTYTRVTAHTIYPETTAQGYLIYDLLDAIIRRICGASLYSEFLGSQSTNSRQYPSNGCGWMYAILKGLQIRQYTLTEKPFFASFNQIWNGIHPILCLGLDYEELDDSPAGRVIRIEQMDHFYSDDVSINIPNVRDIKSSYDKEKIFKSVKVGYKKWQADDISGIDDPQTKRTYSLIFDKVGKELPLESDFIAAGLTVETTRRTTRKKSADYKYDNDIFIIALNEDDVSPDRYIPELDENFDQISGLTDSDTRYNLVLTPMRNLLRWAKYIGGCMQPYANSYYRFAGGEGNYSMFSDYSCTNGRQCQAIVCDPLSERQDISLTDYNSLFGYLHLAQECEMTIPMSKDQYDVIKNNRKKAIGISQTDANFTKFKIKKLVYNLIEGTATINAWPKTFFNIQVINDPIEMPDCSDGGDSNPCDASMKYLDDAVGFIDDGLITPWLIAPYNLNGKSMRSQSMSTPVPNGTNINVEIVIVSGALQNLSVDLLDNSNNLIQTVTFGNRTTGTHVVGATTVGQVHKVRINAAGNNSNTFGKISSIAINSSSVNVLVNATDFSSGWANEDNAGSVDWSFGVDEAVAVVGSFPNDLTDYARFSWAVPFVQSGDSVSGSITHNIELGVSGVLYVLIQNALFSNEEIWNSGTITGTGNDVTETIPSYIVNQNGNSRLLFYFLRSLGSGIVSVKDVYLEKPASSYPVPNGDFMGTFSDWTQSGTPGYTWTSEIIGGTDGVAVLTVPSPLFGLDYNYQGGVGASGRIKRTDILMLTGDYQLDISYNSTQFGAQTQLLLEFRNGNTLVSSYTDTVTNAGAISTQFSIDSMVDNVRITATCVSGSGRFFIENLLLTCV